MGESGVAQLAADLLAECSELESNCQRANVALPTLQVGANTDFWSSTSSECSVARTRALGLLDRLQVLLLGPHDFLHEFVAPNWDHGALYALLQSSVLETIHATSDGRASLATLATQSGIPPDKLSRIIGLLRCRHLLKEEEDGDISLTAVSEELLHDADFRAWVEFQLFDTRVASAHLATALHLKPNDYANGTSGFKQGWGMEMYDWHAAHPDKGDRFRRAMRGVSKSLDPADSLIRTWIQQNSAPSDARNVVELGGRYGFASTSLVSEYPDFTFEIRCESSEFLSRSQALVPAHHQSRIAFTQVPSLAVATPADHHGPLLYIIRNLLWNWADHEAIQLLQALLPSLRASRSTRILVTDGVSPGTREFPPHVEIGYRRRDITTMTMHNVKQRSQVEWLEMFGRVDPGLKVATTVESVSHVCKGLWELSLGVEGSAGQDSSS